jgi:hypothetical protein
MAKPRKKSGLQLALIGSCKNSFLNDAFADWKLKVFEQLLDLLKPDILHTHDDWGSKTALFFSPAKFRDLLKPHYARMYGYVKKRGVLIQHHADSISRELKMTWSIWVLTCGRELFLQMISFRSRKHKGQNACDGRTRSGCDRRF